jgi:hypothetical protein
MVLLETHNQTRYLVCQESVHEESHGIGPTPIMCRTAAASVKATRRIPALPHDGQHIGLFENQAGRFYIYHVFCDYCP